LQLNFESFTISPVQISEIASVENFEADAINDFSVFFASTELVIRHETEKCGDEIFNANKAQILSERLRVEEGEEAA
jgi:hypothetical protein